MNVYKIKGIVKRVVYQYVQAADEKEAVEKFRELEDVDRVIKVEIDE